MEKARWLTNRVFAGIARHIREGLVNVKDAPVVGILVIPGNNNRFGGNSPKRLEQLLKD
jgi:hypothetical protein